MYTYIIHTRKNGCDPHLQGYYSNSNYREKMVLMFPSKYLVLVARFQSTHFESDGPEQSFAKYKHIT